MIRLDKMDLMYSFMYTVMFGLLLGLYGLNFNRCLSLGMILAQFYLALVKIHFRIRR